MQISVFTSNISAVIIASNDPTDKFSILEFWDSGFVRDLLDIDARENLPLLSLRLVKTSITLILTHTTGYAVVINFNPVAF